MLRQHFRFKRLVLGLAFGLAIAAFGASAVQARPAGGGGYGPLDPWAYGLIHRSTQVNVVVPAKYGPLDPWAYAVVHRGSSGSVVPADVRDHRLVAQLVAQGGSSDSYIGHPGGPGAAGPVLPEYDGVALNRDLIGGPGGAGPVLSVKAEPRGGGFNWGDAGIGASASLGAALLLLTAVTLGLRYRRRIDQSGLATS
jgi:hypothetical protein